MSENKQEEILSLMKTDWELGKSAVTGRFWAQKGGLSSGGISLNFNERDVHALLDQNKIKVSRDDGKLPRLYALT